MDTVTSEALSSRFTVKAVRTERPDAGRSTRRFDYVPLIRGGVFPLSDLLSLFLLVPLVSTLCVLTTSPSHSGNWMVTSRFPSLWSETFVIALLVGILLWAGGHYTERHSLWCETHRLTSACALASLMVMLWPFSDVDFVSRVAIAGIWLLLPLWMLALRQAVRAGLSRAGFWNLPVVVVAAPDAMEWVERTLNSRRPADFDVVDTVVPGSVEDWPDRSWRELLAHCRAQRLIVATAPGTPGHDQLLKSIVRSRVPFTLIFDSCELPVYGMHQTRALRSDAIILSYQSGCSRPVMRLLKMVADVCIASVLLTILAPMLAVLSALVCLDGGPVLYAQERVGENGKRFRCLKFRTMSVNADAVLRQTLASNPVAAQEWAATRKLSRDPRVTRIGKFLRKTSLDELPQLLNVLQLKMSLVGPRPIVQDEIPRYAEDIVFYYETRPGLTGLWQVSGRSDTTYEQRVAYDRWYVKNWTLWHDFVILIMTVPALMTQRGAR